MNKSILNNKTSYIIKLICGGVLFIGLVLTLISYAAESYLKNKIQHTNKLSVKNIRVSWHCNNLYLTDGVHRKDTNYVSFKEISLINIQWISLIKNKTIQFKHVLVKDVDINLLNINQNKNSATLKDLKYTFKVNHLQIKNTNINASKEHQKLNIKALNADVENIEITQKNIHFKKIKYSTSKGIYNNLHSDYTITWNKIETKQKTTTIFNAKLTPKITEKEWIKKYTYKKPKTELTIPELIFNNINYHKILNKNSLNIQTITLKNASLAVLANENKEPDPKAYKPLVNELLHNSTIPIKIKEIELVNNRIDIEVISKTTQKKAVIFFNKINANIFDIQNVKKHKINIQLKALVLNKNTINLDINFWVTPKLFPYSIKGNVSSFEFEQFNSFLLLTKRVRVLSGKCNRLDFSIYGNNHKAYGDIILDYKNVKIGLFDDDEHIMEKLPTFLVNNFLIKQNNIPNTKNYRTGKMYYKRPQNRSMFHSWWYSLKSGFQSVILPNIINKEELDH